MTAQSTELTLTVKTQQAIDYFRTDEMIEQVRYALPENESPRKFVRTLATALMENPDLVLADRTSLTTAVFKAAQMGLLPDGQEAVINVYNTKVKINGKDAWIPKATLIPMVDGYAKRVAEYGWSLVADVVYENDEFDEGSTQQPLFHRRARLGSDRGQPIGAYALATHGTLGFRQEIFTKEQIEVVRQSSKQPNGQLWTKWWDRAWKKTLAKQVAKHLPLNSADKERLAPLLTEIEENGDDPADVLYGARLAPQPEDSAPAPRPQDAQPSSPAQAPDNVDPQTGEIIEEGEWSDGSAEDPDEFAFEGEEPPVAPAIATGTADGEPSEPATFTSGRHAGKTVQQVLDLGDEGTSYIKWACANWKTGSIVDDLAAFAAEHPELMS